MYVIDEWPMHKFGITAHFSQWKHADLPIKETPLLTGNEIHHFKKLFLFSSAEIQAFLIDLK